MCLALLVFGFKAYAAEVRQARDGEGRLIEVAVTSPRVLCLYGGFSELIMEMGQGELLVGRTKADGRNEALVHLPAVGTHMRPNIELVLGLQPDLVVQLAGRSEAAETTKALRGHGLTVALYNPKNFVDLFYVITSLGELLGARKQADGLVKSMKTRLGAVDRVVASVIHRPGVFFEIRENALLAAGQGNIVDAVIQRAGGINVVKSPAKIVRMGQEGLFQLDPEVYVVQQGAMNKNPLHPDRRPRYRLLRAVRKGRVLVVDDQIFSRAGPRVVDAVEELALFLFPDRF